MLQWTSPSHFVFFHLSHDLQELLGLPQSHLPVGLFWGCHLLCSDTWPFRFNCTPVQTTIDLPLSILLGPLPFSWCQGSVMSRLRKLTSHSVQSKSLAEGKSFNLSKYGTDSIWLAGGLGGLRKWRASASKLPPLATSCWVGAANLISHFKGEKDKTRPLSRETLWT